ncbi:MAG: glycine--tRNA ligase [Candidatus Woesearchaeota archaeon]
MIDTNNSGIMAEKSNETIQKEKRSEELTSFLQNKSFIWGPEPEIYGGIAGFYTYAPLGKLLKNNVENAIRKTFIKNNFWEVECPCVMQEEVWIASGHAGGFTDPVIKCSKCKSTFRVDKLIEEVLGDIQLGGKTNEELLLILADNQIKCPSCKGNFVPEILKHNLMMKTTIGLDKVAYNRPETATTTYLPFLRYLTFFRDKLPFGVFQIGKAFRNEISPRQSVLRGREFTQAEGQLFIYKDQKNNFEPYKEVKDNKLPLWSYQMQDGNNNPKLISLSEALEASTLKNQAYAWALNLGFELFKSMGIPAEKIRFRQHNLDERAFYAEDAWDVEIELNSFGWTEVCGIHDRTTYDLTQHAKHSGKNLVATREDGTKEVPHVIEIAFGTDRPTFALLDIFYEKKEVGEGKSVLHLPPRVAPVQVSIFPLVKKEPVDGIALKILDDLKGTFVCRLDRTGSIGKRYVREDEAGTPYCVTVDFEGVENKEESHMTVTLRNRDTEEQKRVHIIKLKHILNELISDKIRFEDIN